MKARSDKRVVQDREERKLKLVLWEEQGGCCADCGWKAPSIGHLDKHEHESRARGGNPCDKANCCLLCRPCHQRRHLNNELKSGHKPVTPSALPGKPWGES